MWEAEFGPLPSEEAVKCAKQMPNVTFVTLPGLDHSAAIEQIDQALPHIKRFLATVDQQAGAAA